MNSNEPDTSPPLHRTGDRSGNKKSRFFHVPDEGWYVRTREGTQGPFETRQQAECALIDLIYAQTGHRPRTAL